MTDPFFQLAPFKASSTFVTLIKTWVIFTVDGTNVGTVIEWNEVVDSVHGISDVHDAARGRDVGVVCVMR